VKLIDLAASDKVRSIARIIQGADDGDIEGEESADDVNESAED